jgi:hypothetical protein
VTDVSLLKSLKTALYTERIAGIYALKSLKLSAYVSLSHSERIALENNYTAPVLVAPFARRALPPTE